EALTERIAFAEGEGVPGVGALARQRAELGTEPGGAGLVAGGVDGLLAAPGAGRDQRPGELVAAAADERQRRAQRLAVGRQPGLEQRAGIVQRAELPVAGRRHQQTLPGDPRGG